MEERDQQEPWDQLRRLVQQHDAQELAGFLEELSPGEAVRAVLRLDPAHQTQLLLTLAPQDAAELIEEMPHAEAAGLVEHLPAETAAAIVQQLPSAEQADLVGELPMSEADAILANMEVPQANQLRSLASYHNDVAGGIMVTELLSYPSEFTVDDVIGDLRANADRYARFNVQYVFVTTNGQRLVGVLRLRDLLLSPRNVMVKQIMQQDLLSFPDDATLDELREFFDSHNYFGVPITDRRGCLLGVVHRSAVEEALGQRAESDYRRSQGILYEELRSMPALVRSRRRLGWLTVNILLNVVAASVIAFFQDTLAQVIALAVFLPIISDMSGCTGNQAVAVSMRELALGVVKPFELAHVWLKEITVGILNGLALGLLIATVAVLWKGNPYLGLVIGTAMATNTIIAVSLGGLLPLAMKRMGIDPALAAGPVLTTITDMCGFFLVLGIATLMLPFLVP
ncbi:MAG: magnesium transporter [Planctomycetales bacterium]|nr:magnesium transporter [Planctomycetales bacterium]NIM09099.1 magnesium transporter [Planctomycetales bacterium]NIN08559.1 magnesium transporter [Planctomycetales bacterium]NIN77692.1 magnesium transporter [Planctomycetales bacterium]NIO34857.1 magnesium transporter [Planctomycetales bacterium]